MAEVKKGSKKGYPGQSGSRLIFFFSKYHSSKQCLSDGEPMRVEPTPRWLMLGSNTYIIGGKKGPRGIGEKDES